MCELTGAVEHVAVAGNVDDRADVVLIAPATANTIGKIASGIDDTPVTTVVTTALGQRIPVVIVPAMHEPMYHHPIVRDNMRRLREIGVDFVTPTVEEGKAKMAPIEEIVAAVHARLLYRDREPPLSGVNVLITAGRTVEYIDPIRCITNNSSGKMGMAVASAALAAGAAVTIVYGKGTAPPPGRAKTIYVETAEEMKRAVYDRLAEERVDVCIAAAAVGDWTPKSKARRKISTDKNGSLTI